MRAQIEGRPDDGAGDRRRSVARRRVVAACAAARGAVAAYNAEAEQDEPGGELAALFERGRLALECVAATRARTPQEIAEKGVLPGDYAVGTDGSEPSHEMVRVAFSLAEDAVALAREMVGVGTPRA